MTTTETTSYLDGLRVVEIADEQAEYCGRVLANLGADVIKVEPIGGSRTRQIGPFVHDEVDREQSLHFWHYNLGKRSIELDLDEADGQADLRRLAATAEVVLESCPVGYLDERGIGYDDLAGLRPGLVFASITPFGTSGPWVDYLGSDLVHLALGGQMTYCGYDPLPDGAYDTPPIAPQMWQAYHMASDHALMGILAAVLHRTMTGEGQRVDVSIHQVAATNTELDVPYWIYNRLPMQRHTTKYSRTKDGRYLYTLHAFPPDALARIASMMDEHGLAGDLNDPKYSDPRVRFQPDNFDHVQSLVDRFVGRYPYEGPWHEAQKRAVLWAPMRRPEENLDDENWIARQTFHEVEHPELGASYRYPVGRWYSDEATWVADRRAPFVGEHGDEIRRELTSLGENS